MNPPLLFAPDKVPLVPMFTLIAEPRAGHEDLRSQVQALIDLFKEMADDPHFDPNLTEEEILICVERFEAMRRMLRGPTARRFERALQMLVPELMRDYRTARTAALKVFSDFIAEGEDRIDRKRSQAGLDEGGFRSMEEVFANLPKAS